MKKGNQNKCYNCGSTNIELNIKTGNLICLDCRCEIESEKIDLLSIDFGDIDGKVVSEGASDIIDDNDIITLKCDSCGAQVVIDTKMAASVKCHWCRNRLSLTNKVPNGAIPDAILPFKIEKQEAFKLMDSFLKKRRFYADKNFLKKFCLDSAYGVYFPYIVINAKYKGNFSGIGQHITRRYTETDSDGDSTTYYDYDEYKISRITDLEVKGLTIESTQEKLAFSNNKTNNIINSIMPFDIESCVKWNSNYLYGYSLEKRDVNVEDVSRKVHVQLSDIARYETNNSINFYNRGVRWDEQSIEVKTEKWQTAYMPVWLYSYEQVQKKETMIHYIAVNGRTKELMGSIPLNKKKLLFFSFLIEMGCILLVISLMYARSFFFISPIGIIFICLFLSIGFIYYNNINKKYRNQNARHYYEKETNRVVNNIEKNDSYISSHRRTQSRMMSEANNDQIFGTNNVDFSKKN